MFGKNKNQKKIDAAMLSINTMLREIYTNRSTEEYKMRGDITKSASYKNIEEMVTDLTKLKGYSANDAKDIRQLFTTLHLPIFKTMVAEYIMEPNDKNTIYTSMFTIGYRLLVGELSRIFASTEATPTGIVYKPDKISRKNDASKMIRIFNKDLEKKLDKYIDDMRKDNTENPVNESFIEMMMKECDNTVKPTTESDEPVDDTTSVDSSTDIDTDSDTSTSDIDLDNADDSVQESVAGVTAALTTVSAVGKVVTLGVGAIAGLFTLANGLLKGFNPISDFNYYFMNSYDKKVAQLDSVSKMYLETKRAYEEYMKIPEAKRSKKVESKYIKNMEKYNLSMKKLSAEVEHFNQRAEKEAQEEVNNMEKKLPDTSAPTGNQNTTSSDDDVMF